MPRRRRHRRLLPAGLLLAMLIGMVVVPAILSLTVGIVALAVWREAFDIVFGVLILTFGASAIAGGISAVGFVRRNARLAELQADFVANVSHELRTPLAGIRLVAETLEAGRGDTPERLAILTEMLGDEVRRLEHLVERVLASRQIDSGQPAAPLEEIAVDALAREAAREILRLPEGRDATVTVTAAPDLPAVVGDRAMLLHALQNLVHNAVNYGGRAGPVEVAVARAGPDVAVTVRDRGPGIAAGDAKRIFERFYRSDSVRGRVRGTGLGLDIVRSVVEDHGGAVSVDSVPGQGAAFTMRLPARPGGPHGS